MNLNPNQPDHSSFLPSDYVKTKGQQRANVVALVLFGVVMSGVAGVFAFNRQRERAVMAERGEIAAQYEAVAAKITTLKELEAQRAEMIANAEIVTALIDRVPRSVLLVELLRGMPDKLILTQIKLDGKRIVVAPPPTTAASRRRTLSAKPGAVKKGDLKVPKVRVLPPKFKHTLALTGLAMGNPEIADYLSSLKASPLLSGVELQYIEQTTINDQPMRKFKVIATIRETADARQVAGAQETTLLLERGPFSGIQIDSN